MTRCFGYIRVSTAKQGSEGVSLQEQRAAIERHAERSGLEVVEWFEERETAAKSGRPVWTRMIKQLRAHQVAGVIIHKIDRSARNLRDWASVGDLIDVGVQVHFANESLDLKTRGGRLSADIQAVVAADFIRNLREETRKGFYGRLKQGLFPLPAPLGYINHGKGQVKTLDPVRAPLVRRLFELYDSGAHTYLTLVPALYELGLRNRRGGRVTKNGVSIMLNNPFYAGIMRVRATRETFPGKHEPLISSALWNRVQARLRGKTHTRSARHDFTFRRLLTCAECEGRLVGELQKNHVYYRCHNAVCLRPCVREERIEEAVKRVLRKLVFDDFERSLLRDEVQALLSTTQQDEATRGDALRCQLGLLEQRLARLTDALIDGVVSKDAFDERRLKLVIEQQELKRQMECAEPVVNARALLATMFERADLAWLSYEMANRDEKRRTLELLTSNRTVSRENVVVELRFPWSAIAARDLVTDCDPNPDVPRTSAGSDRSWATNLVSGLFDWAKKNPKVLHLMMHPEQEVDKAT